MSNVVCDFSLQQVIVTGANGFIGSSFIKKLIKKNIYVTAIDTTFKKTSLPNSQFLKKVISPLNNIIDLENSIPRKEYDAFYHFAWQGVNGEDKANLDIQLNNIQLMVNCATVAKKIGCRKFLCSGSIAEQSTNSLVKLERINGGMFYGVAKHCARLMLEAYCKNIKLDFVWMQFSNIYGPTNKTGNLVSYTITQLQNNEIATFGPASQCYDFIYVDDLLEAVYRLGATKCSRNFYFIGSGKHRILKEYLFEIGRVCMKEESIKIGIRSDDGIHYSSEMFDTSPLVADIGNYVLKSFSEGIKHTVDNF